MRPTIRRRILIIIDVKERIPLLILARAHDLVPVVLQVSDTRRCVALVGTVLRNQ
jgi:hypothetical protein